MTLAYPNYNKHFNNSINFNPLSSYPLQPLDIHDHGLNPKPNIKSLSFNPMDLVRTIKKFDGVIVMNQRPD